MNERKLSELLNISDPQNNGRHKKKLYIAAAAGVIVIVAIIWSLSSDDKKIEYITEPAKRGDLTVLVTATGQLQPVNQVDVGTEVSGTIETVDVEHNDLVKQGQVLARLDTDRFQAQVMQSKAAVESAQAKLAEAQASVVESQSKYDRLKRAHELSGGTIPSIQEIEAAEAALKRAKAAKLSAQAMIAESKAKLNVDQTNLEKAIIRAPINGIVLHRLVEPGQTVAASLQAPVMFTLAEDLTRMELHLDVDEADIGKVVEGQSAKFSVDAYPNRTFPATVTEVRFAPQTVEGVVTYRVILAVKNSERLLRPGMTATADITVQQVKDAVLIPNAALRFSPPKKSEKEPERGGGFLGSIFRRPGRHDGERREPEKARGGVQKVWVLEDGKPGPIEVKVGATDDQVTELIEGKVEPGTELITDTKETGK